MTMEEEFLKEFEEWLMGATNKDNFLDIAEPLCYINDEDDSNKNKEPAMWYLTMFDANQYFKYY